jgi:hypothetical protein
VEAKHGALYGGPLPHASRAATGPAFAPRRARLDTFSPRGESLGHLEQPDVAGADDHGRTGVRRAMRGVANVSVHEPDLQHRVWLVVRGLGRTCPRVLDGRRHAQ